MTPGQISLPDDQFAFPRSYVGGLYVRHEPGTFSFSDGLLQFVVGVPPNALCQIQFDDRFVEWSSNRWTLDHIIETATYTTIPGGIVGELPFYVQWMYPPDKGRGHLLIDTTYGALYTVVGLPTAPGDYWLPPAYG